MSLASEEARAGRHPRIGPDPHDPNRTAVQGDRGLRRDLELIAEIVEPGARVLDVGCGDGALLAYLGETRGVDGRGLELSMEGVGAAVRHGLSVIQGNADTDLAHYPSDAFDYVILSQTLQATQRPREVLEHMMRIGRRGIVTFPNFGHYRARLYLLFKGRMPITDPLPDQWWETPNIHICTLLDFRALCEDMGIPIEKALTLDHLGRAQRYSATHPLANWMAAAALFMLGRGPDS